MNNVRVLKSAISGKKEAATTNGRVLKSASGVRVLKSAISGVISANFVKVFSVNVTDNSIIISFKEQTFGILKRNDKFEQVSTNITNESELKNAMTIGRHMKKMMLQDFEECSNTCNLIAESATSILSFSNKITKFLSPAVA